MKQVILCVQPGKWAYQDITVPTSNAFLKSVANGPIIIGTNNAYLYALPMGLVGYYHTYKQFFPALAVQMGLMPHCGPEQPRIQNGVLGHSLVRSLVRSHRSLVELAPPCSLPLCAPLRSLLCSPAHFTHSLARGKANF